MAGQLAYKGTVAEVLKSVVVDRESLPAVLHEAQTR
jgi:hypothetical protein